MAVSDIVVGGASVYRAAVGTTLPAKTVAAGAAWTTPSGWTNIGYTTAPIAMSVNFEFFDVKVEQTISVVKTVKTAEDVMLETTLAEMTGPNIALVTGGTNTATAQSTGVAKDDTFKFGGKGLLDFYAIGIDGIYQDDANAQFPIRLLFYRCYVSMNGQLAFAKADVAGIPLQIKANANLTATVGEQIAEGYIVQTAPGS